MLDRRKVLQSGAAAVAVGLVDARLADAQVVAVEPFVDVLPIPDVATTAETTAWDTAGTQAPLYKLAAVPLQHQFHRDLAPTSLWTYVAPSQSKPHYLGPTIIAQEKMPLVVEMTNSLPADDHPLWAAKFQTAVPPDIWMKVGAANRLSTHLHGAIVEHDSDGWPEEYILPGMSPKRYRYPNAQAAATLWYHDHAIGITRLNVVMGLAGLYVIGDGKPGLPEIPLVLQDRDLRPDGTLVYPKEIEPEYFGTSMLVNGKIAPYVDVQATKYKLRILNGCNSRFLVLSLRDPDDLPVADGFLQVASEQGSIKPSLKRDWLRLAPGERVEVEVDFGRFSNGQVQLVNAMPPEVYKGKPLDMFHAQDRCLQFNVGAPPAVIAPPLVMSARDVVPAYELKAILPRAEQLTQLIVPKLSVYPERVFRLEEITPESGSGICTNKNTVAPVIRCLSGSAFDSGAWKDELPFRPTPLVAERWTFFNATEDSHPIHVHAAQLFVESRAGGPPVEIGSAEVDVQKDTVQIHPGETVSLIVTFNDYPGRFPMHCHILEHEDCEMMRWFEVAPAGA